MVGAGISGLSAALELGRGGADVTVLDMASVFGGHAVMSQGGVCIVQTPTQTRQGIEDSPKLAYEDFIRWGEDANADWVRYYVDHSKREIYDWLTEMGVEFASVETAPGNTVDRFHQPSGRGVGLVTPIYRECLELANIQFAWNTKVEQLLNVDGHVSGVTTRNTRSGEVQTRQAEAVILATGGFQSNLRMVREFWPAEFRFPDRILAGSGRNSVGHGHRLAQRAGADLTNMDYQVELLHGNSRSSLSRQRPRPERRQHVRHYRQCPGPAFREPAELGQGGDAEATRGKKRPRSGSCSTRPASRSSSSPAPIGPTLATSRKPFSKTRI